MWAFLGVPASKVWNSIAEDRLHLWGRRKNQPVVPEMTRAELEQESKRLQEKQGRKD